MVSVTNSFKQNLSNRGIDPGKIFVVTNGVDTSHFLPAPKDQALLVELNLNDAFVAGYIGTHGMAHGLDTVIDAAKILADSEHAAKIRIVMLGDGAHRQRLEDRAKAEGLNNIQFISSVPKSDVTRYWSILDASIIHLKKSELFKTVIPSKMFECMGMAIPILHGVEGESAEIVITNEIGVTFESENHIQLVERLLALYGDWEMRERLSRNGPLAAIQYDRKALAQKMLAVIERCVILEADSKVHVI